MTLVAPSTQENVKYNASKVVDKVSNAANEASDNLQDLKNRTKTKAEDAVRRDETSEAADKDSAIISTLKHAKDTAVNLASQAGNYAADLTNKAATNVQDWTHRNETEAKHLAKVAENNAWIQYDIKSWLSFF